jgi:hypothetical protein
MSMSPRLPSVLQIPCKQSAGMGYQSNSLSVERVLNQAIRLISAYQETLMGGTDWEKAEEDQCNVTLDDLAEMVRRIE